jgi:NADPH-dependent 2,4-dienoyl-CoA reductase/sulfur reductase-like enzyme/nitrite reductase/ring-hydroxylating ferredoxin subunit
MAEHVIGSVGEFPDGTMKQVEAGGLKLVIVNQGGEFSALGGECPHQGGPLAEGVLHAGHVRCPWHQACFCARTGDLEQPPALDSMDRFDVRVDDGRVIVSVPDGAGLHRTPEMAAYDPQADARTFAIVGGGASAGAAAEALRQAGYQGRILMITREDCGPYDRTELSKYYLSKPQAPKIALRGPEFYEQCGVELMAGCEVTAVDPEARRIELANGESIQYDACLLATGSRARRLPVEGMDLPGVLTLRSLADADAIRAAAAGVENVVVVGASFIGTEVAGSLTKAGKAVTVVAPESVPFERVLGARVGAALKALHEKNGTRFRLGASLERFAGDGKVEAVVLQGGERLSADLVVVGVGARPVTDYVKGVALNPDGSVSVDATMRAADGVWAAGDIARFPDPRTGEPIRVEHWRLALQLGRVAAMNMAGRPTRYDDMPFFWTDQAGTVLAYVGHAPKWDETIVDGDVESGSGFLVHYVQEGHVRAACAIYRDAEMGAIAELMRANAMPTPDELRAGGVDLVERARQCG